MYISTSDERFLLRLDKSRKQIMGKRRERAREKEREREKEKVERSCVEGDEEERGAL